MLTSVTVICLLLVWPLANGQQSGHVPQQSGQQPQADEAPPRFSIGLGVLSPSYSQKFGDDGKIKLDFNSPNEKGAFSYSVTNLVHPTVVQQTARSDDKGVLAAAPTHKDNPSPSLSYSPSYSAPGHRPDYSGVGAGVGTNYPQSPLFSYSPQGPPQGLQAPPQSYQNPGQYNYANNNFRPAAAPASSPNDGSYNPNGPGGHLYAAYNQPYANSPQQSPPQQPYNYQPTPVGPESYGQQPRNIGYGQQGYYQQQSGPNPSLYGAGSNNGPTVAAAAAAKPVAVADEKAKEATESYGGLSPEAINAFRQIYALGSDPYSSYLSPYGGYGGSPYGGAGYGYGGYGGYGAGYGGGYGGYGSGYGSGYGGGYRGYGGITGLRNSLTSGISSLFG